MPKTSAPLLILLLAGVLFVASGQAPGAGPRSISPLLHTLLVPRSR